MAPANTVLIVGASRGLGAALAEQYASQSFKVFATARSAPKESVTFTNLNSAFLTLLEHFPIASHGYHMSTLPALMPAPSSYSLIQTSTMTLSSSLRATSARNPSTRRTLTPSYLCTRSPLSDPCSLRSRSSRLEPSRRAVRSS